MAGPSNPSIDGRRLWNRLMVMAKIGATEMGGCCRLAQTDLGKRGRDLFVSWCKNTGCTIQVDKMGNIFARGVGRNDELAPVITGSHLDTGARHPGQGRICRMMPQATP